MEKIALRLQVTTRTLRSWKLKAKKECQKRSGRPRYSKDDHKKAIILVCRELHRQGYPGSPAIAHALKGKVQLRLIRHYVKLFKTRKRLRKAAEIESKRSSVKVNFANAVWTQDGTHLGRMHGKAVEAQIIKDRASLKTVCAFTGKAANGKDVVLAMKMLKKKRGLPLVWMTDNGAAYCNREVKRFVDQEKIVHLKSLPRTPQHNGAAEVMMREIKCGSLLGKKRYLESIETAHAELVKIIQRLDDRARESLKFKSAREIDDELSMVSRNVSRKLFFAEYCLEMNKLKREDLSWRVMRMQEREVVMCLLEKYELIKRTRGGKDYVA